MKEASNRKNSKSKSYLEWPPLLAQKSRWTARGRRRVVHHVQGYHYHRKVLTVWVQITNSWACPCRLRVWSKYVVRLRGEPAQGTWRYTRCRGRPPWSVPSWWPSPSRGGLALAYKPILWGERRGMWNCVTWEIQIHLTSCTASLRGIGWSGRGLAGPSWQGNIPGVTWLDVTSSHQMTCHLIEEGGQVVMGPCIVEPAVETQNGFARGISPGLNKSNCNRFDNKCCEIITFPAMCPYGTGILISVASPEMIFIKAQRLFLLFTWYKSHRILSDRWAQNVSES